MNRYDLLVILGLIVLFISPILIVTYRFTEPASLPLGTHIKIWPIAGSLVIPSSIAVLLSFAWTILGLIQAFNIANVTRGTYRLVFAWIILILTAMIQYVIITEHVIPFVEFWRDAYRRIDFNTLPPLLLNSGLFFYSLTRLRKQEAVNIEEH